MVISKLNRRQVRWLVGAVLASAVLLVWLVARYVNPTPPNRFVFTGGGANGAYDRYAQQYAQHVRAARMTMEIKTSAGSVQNLERLQSGEADAGFVQGGLGSNSTQPDADPDDLPLRSLGVVAYEPVWVFSRADLTAGLQPLRGKRVAVGPEGSGSRKVAVEVLGAFGLSAGEVGLVPESGPAAAQALIGGQLDAAILVAPPESATIRTLLAAPGLRLASPPQLAGVTRQLPYLQTVTLLRGAVNAAANVPPTDVLLLATTANLVVRKELHPAVQSLLIESARPVHRKASIVSSRGEFPRAQGADFPVSEEAERFYREGRPFLQRYLPFWLANFLTRLLLVLVPLVAIAVPLLRAIPQLMEYRDKTRLYKRYADLKMIEDDVRLRQLSAEEIRQARLKLSSIEQEISNANFPLDFTDRVYTFRQHVSYVRSQLEEEAKTAPPEGLPKAA